MKRNGNYFLRKVGDTFFLVPSDELAGKKMIFLNETSVFLWNHLVERCTIDDLVGNILNSYNVDQEVAYQHVERFVSFLSENGCIDLKEED